MLIATVLNSGSEFLIVALIFCVAIALVGVGIAIYDERIVRRAGPRALMLRKAFVAASKRYKACRVNHVLPAGADASYRKACFHYQEALRVGSTEAESAGLLADKGLAELATFNQMVDKI